MTDNKEKKTFKRKTKWSDDEIFFLKESYASYHYPLERISEILQVSKAVVSRKAKELGLKKITCSNYPVEEGHKICRRCLEILPVENFWRNKAKDTETQIGYDSYCKVCAKGRIADKKLRELEIQEKKKEQDRLDYIEKRKDKIFVCSTCKKEKGIHEYSVHFKKHPKNEYFVSRSSICKRCYVEKAESASIKKLQKQGHV